MTAEFERFWKAWPTNRSGGYMRKGGRAECLKRWIKHHHNTQADTIIKHVEWLKTTAEWLKDNGAFIPMPITYLNQQRWDGADVPENSHSTSEVERSVEWLSLFEKQTSQTAKPANRQLIESLKAKIRAKGVA